MSGAAPRRSFRLHRAATRCEAVVCPSAAREAGQHGEPPKPCYTFSPMSLAYSTSQRDSIPFWQRLALKAWQRGKHGEVVSPSDRTLMDEPSINATLWPGSVLYVPRGHFHHTATAAAMLAAPDVIADASLDATGATRASDDGKAQLADVEGQPSMALTFSVLSEDVLASWLHLLGEAVEDLAQQQGEAAAMAEEARRMSRALRRRARGAPTDTDDGGVRLRESLPRALLAPCERLPRAMFANADAKWDRWRQHARALLAEAWATFDGTRGGAMLPGWVETFDADTPLAQALDGVLVRKRTPCHNKLDQARPPPWTPPGCTAPFRAPSIQHVTFT